MYWRNFSRRVWLFGLFLVVVLIVAFSLSLSRIAKSSIINQSLDHQQTIARAQAGSIESFFEVFGNSVALRTRLRGMNQLNGVTAQDLDAFVEQWSNSGLVGGIALTDKNGIVQLNSNVKGTKDVGTNLSDRDYFVWAKNHAKVGEYFVGKPVVGRGIATNGQAIVPVAASVFKNGSFDGLLISSVKLNPLSKRYFELMKISNSTDVYIIGESGEVLHSNSTTDSKDINSEIKTLLKWGSDGKFQTSTNLIAYSSIRLSNQNWLLVMSSPIQDMTDLPRAVYLRLSIILILVLVSIYSFGVVTSQELKQKLE